MRPRRSRGRGDNGNGDNGRKGLTALATFHRLIGILVGNDLEGLAMGALGLHVFRIESRRGEVKRNFVDGGSNAG